MGIDVNMYVETKASEEYVAAAESVFLARSSVADRYTRNDGTVVWPAMQKGKYGMTNRVTVNVTCRYWGPDYERGDWPGIYGAIRLVQALFPGDRVFYGGDTSDDGEECTEEMLAEFWEHFVSPAGDEYRNRSRAFNGGERVEWPVPVVPAPAVRSTPETKEVS